jgi:hypothetical protein
MPEIEPKDGEEEKRKTPGYADKGSHGERHNHQEEVRKEQKSCDRNCVNCPLSKTCGK